MCVKYNNIYRGVNMFNFEEYYKKCYKDYKDRIKKREKQKKYRQEHHEKIREIEKRSYWKHREKRILFSKKWMSEHKNYTKNWNKKNPEKYKETYTRCNKKIRSTCNGRLDDSMSANIRSALKGNKAGRHWEDLVGYTLSELKNRLELLFTHGMTWNNYGKDGWEVDHIRPKVSFHYKYPEDKEFKECWSLSNLQPLWATTIIIDGVEYIGNRNKHDKVLKNKGSYYGV